jgi:hypothetical protein
MIALILIVSASVRRRRLFGAALMADEFDGIDTRSEVFRIVSQISQTSNEEGLRRDDATAANRARRVSRR